MDTSHVKTMQIVYTDASMTRETPFVFTDWRDLGQSPPLHAFYFLTPNIPQMEKLSPPPTFLRLLCEWQLPS